MILRTKQNKAPLFLTDLSDEDTKEQHRHDQADPSKCLTESNNQRTEKRDEEFFTLDYSLFDIISTPPDLPMDTTSLGSSETSTNGPSILNTNYHPQGCHSANTLQDRRSPIDRSILPSSSTITFLAAPLSTTTFSSGNNMPKVPSSLATRPNVPENENVKAGAMIDETGVPNSDLAELEAWLLSDAVIITD